MGPRPQKPLPVLPVENIPQRPAPPSAAGQIIRRVSNIFKKRPAALTISSAGLGRIYESSLYSPTDDDDDDDIRRPSGLGSAASISSLPPSPFTLTHPISSYPIRSSSTPNLLSSYGAPRKASPEPRVSLSSMPSETVALIFSHLSKSGLAQIARTCRLFISTARALLYSDVCLNTLSPVQVESLTAVLGSRLDLTDLVRTFTCESWPSFFLTTSGTSMWRSSTFFDPDHQHRNTLLTATFTLAFQRMSNLTTLTLPSYDHDLLAHHTAFCLQSITFTCSTLSKEEAHALFAWLDGQTNIASLLFPKLVQDTEYGSLVEQPTRSAPVSITTRPATSIGFPPQAPGRKYLVAPFLVPINTSNSPASKRSSISSSHPRPPSQKQTQRPKSAAPISPSYATTTFAESLDPSKIPFPSSEQSELYPDFGSSAPQQSYHKQNQHSIFSVTLLPNLTNLHAPPSLVIALASPPSSLSTDHNGRQRPLHSVHINITSTLYSGLRPSTIMSKLTGVTRRLGLYFSENVDRRSVEKVLGAAGSSLGGVRQSLGGLLDDSGGDDRKKRKEFKFGAGEWKGLIELDVKFMPGGPGSDEVSSSPFHGEKQAQSLTAL
jgi:hypothetical protein